MLPFPPRRSRSGLNIRNRKGGTAKFFLFSIKCTFVIAASLAAMDTLLSSRLAETGDNGADGALARLQPPTKKNRSSGGRVVSAVEEKPPYLTTTPLLVFTSNRDAYLDKTLSALLEHHPVNLRSRKIYGGPVIGSPLIISQDGGTERHAKRVVAKFRAKFEQIGVPVFHLAHDKLDTPNAKGGAYRDLCMHYGWALERVFSGLVYYLDDASGGAATLTEPRRRSPPQPDRVIIMEEDVQIAPDFFPLLSSLIPLLDSDESLMAVSAFNDNGKRRLVGDTRRLVRSDFFPGLGWMLPRRIWDELRPKWPGLYWDDWIRQADIRKGRQVIRPEVPRTFHFGVKGGASRNWKGQHLRDVQLNTIDVRWEDMDLSYLHKDVFRERYYERVMSAQEVSTNDVLTAVKTSDVRLVYRSFAEFVKYAKHFQLYDDERGGIPCSAYENIVDFRPCFGGKVPSKYVVFIAPPLDEMRKNLDEGKYRSPEDFAKTLLLNPELHTGDLSVFK